MLRGYWGDILAIGRVAILVGAAFAWAAMIWSISANYTKRALDTQAQASQYRENAAERVNRACVGRAGSGLLECVTQQIEATREHEQSEYDLQAQQDMSDWAFWMMLLATGSLTLGVVGVWYVRETLRATREGTSATITEARRIGEAQVRCYLSITNVTMTIHKDGLIDFIAEAANSGQSPAKNVKLLYLVTAHALRSEVRQEIAGDVSGNKGIFTIRANSTFAFPGQTCTEGLNSDLLSDVISGSGRVSIRIELLLQWRDVFGVEDSALETFSSAMSTLTIDEPIVMPSEQQMASRLLSQVYRLKHRGEWKDEPEGDEGGEDRA